MLVRIVIVLFVFSSPMVLGADEETSKPNPWVSGTLGAIIPGAGYIYNGDSSKGALALPLTAGMILPLFVRATTNEGKSLRESAFVISRNVYGFSVYDSFQDALDLNGRPSLLVDIPHYTAGQLFTAPLKLKNYDSPKVWVPLSIVGGLMALGVVGEHIQNKPKLSAEKIALGIPAILLLTLFVGSGEEADVRGFYYPAFAEATGSRFVGALLQSALFGYMHTDWPGRGFPMVTGGIVSEALRVTPPTFKGTNLFKFCATFLMGLHHAWITSSEQDGLLKSAALHAAWDFIILTGALLAHNEAPPVVFSINF